MQKSGKRLIVFARYPEAGRVKTRLIPALGAEAAAALYRRLVLRTLRTARAACRRVQAKLELRFDGGNQDSLRHWLGFDTWCRPQNEGDLGQRMSNAFEESFREGAASTVIIGSDCPGLTPELIASAFDSLATTPAVFGPANDGGYYLVGLSRMIPELFRGMAWSQDKVLADSLAVLANAGLNPALLPPLDDVDRPEDLPAWRKTIEAEEADLARISVIVPAVNEAKHIVQTLQAAREGGPHEIIVVDGGSSEGTRELASKNGAVVLDSPPGRSRQMNAGAANATGASLVFLHADTLLPQNWVQVVSMTLQDPAVAVGAFRFRIAGDFRGKRLVQWAANLRSTWLQRPYGDQALFLRRSVFEETGGFADLPIMEDYELVTRLRRKGRVLTTAESVLTSGRRWQTLGAFRTTWINQSVLVSYHLGLSLSNAARRHQTASRVP